MVLVGDPDHIPPVCVDSLWDTSILEDFDAQRNSLWESFDSVLILEYKYSPNCDSPDAVYLAAF